MMIFRFCLLIALVAISLWLPGTYKRVGHGFRLAKCHLIWPEVPSWAANPLSSEKEIEIHEILKKPFTYLGKGAQSYVFLSQNGQYVLKLFQFDQCPIPFGKELKTRWKEWSENRHIERFNFKDKALRTFNSYKLAYDLAPDLTALVYIHLNPKKTELPFITVQDRLKRAHTIDPTHYRFILQKRATPFVAAMSKALLDGSTQTLVQSYLALIDNLEALAIANRDPTMSRNFAFLGNQAIVIDAGSFFYDPILAKESKKNFDTRLRDWLKNHTNE